MDFKGCIYKEEKREHRLLQLSPMLLSHTTCKAMGVGAVRNLKMSKMYYHWKLNEQAMTFQAIRHEVSLSINIQEGNVIIEL